MQLEWWPTKSYNLQQTRYRLKVKVSSVLMYEQPEYM